MPLPSTGYALATVTNPRSSLTDFTLMVDLSRMPAEWWAEVDTSDGTKGAAAIDGGSPTELARDWIDFNSGANTGWLRVKWAGTLSNAGTQKLRVYPPKAANTAQGVSDTYGQYNAYDSNWKAYWPLRADGNDRTSNGNTLTANGGMSFGGASTGPTGKSSTFDGSNDYAQAASLVSATNFTVMGWGRHDGGTTLVAQDNDSDQCTFALRPTASEDVARFSDLGYITVRRDATGAFEQYGLVYDGSNLIAYRSGANIAQTAASSVLLYQATGGTLAVGRIHTFGQYWQGDIADVQIHSTGRAAAWIDEDNDELASQSTFWGTWVWTAAAAGHPAMRRLGMAEGFRPIEIGRESLRVA